MFPNFFQNGLNIELYNAQSKDLLKNWKFTGKVEKEYDTNLKGYLHNLTAGGLSKMQIPQNDKQSIGIIHNYLLFQLYLVSSKCFTIEISISDSSNTKRRIVLSSSSKETSVHSLHCKIPLTTFPIGVWVNFTVNIGNIVNECFKNKSLRSIDTIYLSANCKIKKICSLKNSSDPLPKALILPFGINCCNVLLNFDQLDISEMQKEDESNYINIDNNNNNINTKRYIYCKNVNECTQLRSRSQKKPFLPKKSKNNNDTQNENVPKGYPNVNKSDNTNANKSDNPNEVNITQNKKKINTPDNKIGKKGIIQYDNNGRKINLNPQINLKETNKVNIPQNNFIISSKTPNNLQTDYKQDFDGGNSNGKFTTTFNLNNSLKGIPLNLVGDSIEEIYDYNENNGTIIDESLIKVKNCNDYELNKQIMRHEEELNNYQQNLFNKARNNNIREDEDDKNKQKFLEEMYNDMPSMNVLESNRPFTPPITKLIPVKFDSKNRQMNMKVEFDEKDNNNTDKDIIYDKVLGCYYDPQSNEYFNIKNTEA